MWNFNSILTSYQHHTDREDFLRVCVRGDVAEPDAGETAEREVERCNVLGLDGGPTTGDIVHVILVRLVGKVIQPPDLMLELLSLCRPDRVPDARQPVGY